MAVALDTNTYKLSQKSSAFYDLRVKSFQYGDGYKQSVKDGINANIEEWSLVFEPLSVASATTLRELLFNSKNGSSNYLSWTPPGESTTKYWMLKDTVGWSYLSTYVNVTATLERVYLP